MNQQQRKYAMQRVTDIKDEKISALQTRYTKKGKSLTWAERIRLIRKGLVKLKANQSINELFWHNQGEIEHVFDFSKYEYTDTLDEKLFTLGQDRILKKFTKIIDEIMLGDAKEAMKLIRDFEAL